MNLFEIVLCLDELLDSVERASQSMLSFGKVKFRMINLSIELNRLVNLGDPEILAIFFAKREVLNFEE